MGMRFSFVRGFVALTFFQCNAILTKSLFFRVFVGVLKRRLSPTPRPLIIRLPGRDD